MVDSDLAVHRDDEAASGQETSDGEVKSIGEVDEQERMDEGRGAKRKHSDSDDGGVEKKKKKKKEKKHKKEKKAKKEKEKEKEKKESDEARRDKEEKERSSRRDTSKSRDDIENRSDRRSPVRRRDESRSKRSKSRERVRERTRSPRREDRREDRRDSRRDRDRRSPVRSARRESPRRDRSITRRRTPSKDSRDNRDARRGDRRSSNDGRRRDSDRRSRERRDSKKDSKRERSESPPKIDQDFEMDSEDEDKKIEEARRRRQEIAKQLLPSEQIFPQQTAADESESSDDETDIDAELKGFERDMDTPETVGTDSPFEFAKEQKEKILSTAVDGYAEESKDDQVAKSPRQFDMFADEVEIPVANPEALVLEAMDDTNASLRDNWDDAEAYYRGRLGELIDSRYRLFGIVGRGVFGSVVRCTDVDRNTTVAIKILRNNEIMRKTGVKESEILRKLNEADREDKGHCLQLIHTFDHHNHFCLVFENLAMNLRELLKKYGNKVGLHMKAVKSYARQLLLALRLLKKCDIVHADIKPDNILVDESKSTLKLCDFGSSGALHEQELAPLLVSRFYRAPEIMLGIRHDYGIDMWAVAVTLFEVSTGNIMFPGSTNNHMLKLFTEVKGAFHNKMIRKGAFKDEHFDSNCNFLYQETDKLTQRDKITVLSNIRPSRNLDDELVGNSKLAKDALSRLRDFRNLLEQMLTLDPSKRITVGAALSHPFFVNQ